MRCRRSCDETARRLIERGQSVIIGARLSPEKIGGPEATDTLNANVAGIVRVTHAFLRLLERSEHPAIVNVGSGMGSLALTHDPECVESKPVAPLYAASKAAVTMLTAQYAKAFPGIRVDAADPGYTDAIVTLATEATEAGTGRFIDRYGPVR